MKRWAAVLMAVMVLCTGVPGLTESGRDQADRDQEIVDIQESMVTREGDSVGTLAENLAFLKEALQDEEIRNLLQIQDVKDIANEIVWKVVVWLYENRPVTMKILAELGVKKSDRHCVEMIWDSYDRIAEAYKLYMETDEGRLLEEKAVTLSKDPDILEAGQNFINMLTSNNIKYLLEQIEETVKEGAQQKHEQGQLTQMALDRQLNRTSFIGSLTIKLLHFIEESDWARESVPKLLQKEDLWTFLTLLSEGSVELNKVVQQETMTLMEDTEMKGFIQRTADEALLLSRELESDLLKNGSGENRNETNAEGTNPEVTNTEETDSEISEPAETEKTEETKEDAAK